MHDLVWTNAEKKIARLAFDTAVSAEINSLISEFKRRAAATKEKADLWEIRDWLNNRQGEIDHEYDYRYSQLIFVFARLVEKDKIKMYQLSGLSEDKISKIAHLAGV